MILTRLPVADEKLASLFGQFQTRYAELFRKTLGKTEEFQVKALLLSVDFA
jgi:hypothetical protein